MTDPSYGISIRDTASPVLDELAEDIDRRGYLGQLAGDGVRILIDHFAAKEGEASSHVTATRLGASPSGLYAAFARATHSRITGNSVILSVNHVAARQRYKGGAIEPVNTDYLTIPAQAESYAKRASDFGGTLAAMWGKDKQGRIRPVALIDEDAGRDAAGRVPFYDIYFWLVRSVSQAADPSVLPDLDVMAGELTRNLRKWIDLVKRRGRANG